MCFLNIRGGFYFCPSCLNSFPKRYLSVFSHPQYQIITTRKGTRMIMTFTNTKPTKLESFNEHLVIAWQVNDVNKRLTPIIQV